MNGVHYDLGLIVKERDNCATMFFQVIRLFVGIIWVPSGLSNFLYECFVFMKRLEEAYRLC